jgi:hypothetical protein
MRLVPKDHLIQIACTHLLTNLESDDWNIYFPNEEYQPTCPDLEEENEPT